MRHEVRLPSYVRHNAGGRHCQSGLTDRHDLHLRTDHEVNKWRSKAKTRGDRHIGIGSLMAGLIPRVFSIRDHREYHSSGVLPPFLPFHDPRKEEPLITDCRFGDLTLAAAGMHYLHFFLILLT